MRRLPYLGSYSLTNNHSPMVESTATTSDKPVTPSIPSRRLTTSDKPVTPSVPSRRSTRKLPLRKLDKPVTPSVPSMRSTRKLPLRKVHNSPVLLSSPSASTTTEQSTHDKSLQCLKALTHFAANTAAAQESLAWLQANPAARNVLMEVSPDTSPAYSTEAIIFAHMGPHTQEGFLPRLSQDEHVVDYSAPLQFTSPSKNRKNLAEERIAFCSEFVVPVIWANYPNLSLVTKNFDHGMSTFVKALLGPDASDPSVHVGFPELHRRMVLADEAVHLESSLSHGGSTIRPNSTHAQAWQIVDNERLDKRQILIDACAAWYPVLQDMIKGNYLDILADVVTPVTSSSQEPSVDSAPNTRNTEVDHLNLKAADADERSLGSVYHIQNCLSPAFVAHALAVGIPSLPFMRDGMKSGSDRLSRIASASPLTPFRLRKRQPFLMLSDTLLSFEADMLKIGNFLTARLHHHVCNYVQIHHGQKAVDVVVPPLVVFEMIQSSLNFLGDGGYAAHDDSGTFVTDNGRNYGDEDHNMIVPTFFWSNRDDVSTSVTWRDKCNPLSNNCSINTISGGVHLQTYGVQGNLQHLVDRPSTKKIRQEGKPPITKSDHRLAQSLRSTERFQVAHHRILFASNPDIRSVGVASDYNFRLRLGQYTEKNKLMGTPIRPEDPSVERNAEMREYFTPELIQDKGLGSCVSTDDDLPGTAALDDGAEAANSGLLDRFLDVAPAKFPSPLEIYSNYPLGLNRYLKSPLSPYEFFRSGEGLGLLLKERISPVVYLDDKKTNIEVADKVNYGLLMATDPVTKELHPVVPGVVFAAAAVYRTLGLVTSQTDSQVWPFDYERLLGYVMAQFYKNEFPESKTQARGPLLDYRRLKAQGNKLNTTTPQTTGRLGFWGAGQGGAGELTGQVQPDLNKASSGESAVLERAQKVASPGNQAMLLAAQRNAWIQVYVKVGPTTIPEHEVCYDHPLSAPLRNSTMAKVVYLGTYEIENVEYKRVDIAELKKHMEYQESLAAGSEFKLPSTDGDFKRYYRFRTQMHLRFHLKPVEHPLVDRGWRYLRIAKQDPRRIQVLIPPEVPINQALSVGENCITSKQLHNDWVIRDKLYVNFISLPGSSHAQVGSTADEEIDSEVDSMVDDLGMDLEHHDLDKEEQLTALAEERKRSMTSDQVATILRSISVGCFCRLLEINVDSEGQLRPLVDPAPDHNFDLLGFHQHFVCGGSIINVVYDKDHKVQAMDFLPNLGVTVQRYVFPHPIRVYDVGTLYLIICTGGGHKREGRKGFKWLGENMNTATDFLIHSVVLRILGKTHALKSWCEFSRKTLKRIGNWFLPGISELENFLAFVKMAVESNAGGKKRKNECLDFTSEQFQRTLDDQFKCIRGLENVLRTWKRGAKKLLQEFVSRQQRVGKLTDSRERFIRSMVDLFVSGGCSEDGSKLLFVCSQVCADMEELIDELPFGEVGSVCTGPGSKAGLAIFKKEEHIKFLAVMETLSGDQLLMQGLEKTSRGVRIIYNKRYINEVDVEHGCCKIGIFVPKLAGGGGSLSVKPRKQAPHCHPVPGSPFDDSISLTEANRVKEIASNAVGAFRKAVLDKTWQSPESILGEQCWKRPADYLDVDEEADEQRG
jgi:hypothetical protein